MEVKIRIFLTLLNFFFLVSITLGSIYYEKPSLARIVAQQQHLPSDCIYGNKKYHHGEQVDTPEPCLNCTCKRGLVSCFLRVCPDLYSSLVRTNCKLIKEGEKCCPFIKCHNSSQLFPFENETTTVVNKLDDDEKIADTTSFSNILENISSKRKLSRVKTVNKLIDGGVSILKKDKATIFQTNPTTIYHDSPKLVSSNLASSVRNDDKSYLELVNSIQKGCYINSTLYAEGSAIISSSYCEYCYCIRGKKICIRPRCHLAILGCIPRYTSECDCCPTSYDCNKATGESKKENENEIITNLTGTFLSTILPMSSTDQTTTIINTTPAVINLNPTTEILVEETYFQPKACSINGVLYRIGDLIPSDQSCSHCYCSLGGIKRCKKIHCSPVMEGCTPVVPKGHCCPVEYKCSSENQHQFDISSKSRNENDDNDITTLEPLTEFDLDSNLLTLTTENLNKIESSTGSTILEEKLFDASLSEKVYDATTYQPMLMNIEIKKHLHKINELVLLENQTEVPSSKEKNQTHDRDKVGLLIDGLIKIFDQRFQSRLPAEPRIKSQKSDQTKDSLKDNSQNSSFHHSLPSLTTVQNLDPILNVSKEASFSIKLDQNLSNEAKNLEIHEGNIKSVTFAPSLVHNNNSTESFQVFNFTLSTKIGDVNLSDKVNKSYTQPQSYLSNEWKLVTHNHSPRIKVIPLNSSGSEENANQTKPSLDKRARHDFKSEEIVSFLNPFVPNDKFKFIPSSPKDVINLFPESFIKPNLSYSIRVPQIQKLTTDQKPVHHHLTSCKIGEETYLNGALILKPQNPCAICRCFYGRELCQQQICPSPSGPNCNPNYVEGYCCPRYICTDNGPFHSASHFSIPSKNYSHNNSSFSKNSSRLDSNSTDFNTLAFQKIPSHTYRPPLRFPQFPLDSIYPNQVIHQPPLHNVQPNRIHFPNIDKTNLQEKHHKNSVPLLPKTDSLVSLLSSSKPNLIGHEDHILKPQASQTVVIASPAVMFNHISQFHKRPTRLPNTTLLLPSQLDNNDTVETNKSKLTSKHSILTNTTELNSNSTLNTLVTSSSTFSPILILSSTISHKNNEIIFDKSLISALEATSTSNPNFVFNQNESNLVNRMIESSTIISTKIEEVSISPPALEAHNPWDLLKVSGCNIYGTFFKVDQIIDELSSLCKKCICSAFGVKCNKTC